MTGSGRGFVGDFPGRNVLIALYLAVLMVPYQIFLLPQFLIMARLGLVNTLAALISPGLFEAFGTFLMRRPFKGFRASWRTPPR
jgi:multiple sugar transport system permease protein